MSYGPQPYGFLDLETQYQIHQAIQDTNEKCREQKEADRLWALCEHGHIFDPRLQRCTECGMTDVEYHSQRVKAKCVASDSKLAEGGQVRVDEVNRLLSIIEASPVLKQVVQNFAIVKPSNYQESKCVK